MWYVRDVLYAVLYVRVSCFVVRGCGVSRRYIDVCYCDMFSVVNDTAYKQWSCYSGLKLLCKLCRTNGGPVYFPVFICFIVWVTSCSVGTPVAISRLSLGAGGSAVMVGASVLAYLLYNY